MRRNHWLASGLIGWGWLLAGSVAWAQGPLALTLTTNQASFAPGERLEVTVGVETSGIAGTAADFYLGAVLPGGSTVVTFGPGGTLGVGSLADLSPLPAYASGVSLTSPFTLPPQTVLEYQWTGSEPFGQYQFFAAAVRAGSLADGSLGPADLLAFVSRTVQLGAGGDQDWRGFADSRAVDAATNALSLLQARAPVLCAGATPAPEPSLGDALASLVAGLQQLAGQPALDGFLASLGDLSRVPAVAAAGIADRKPHAALAALLAAAVSEPRNPSHLVNAAGLASLLGFPAEALSLLTAAEALGLDTYSPLGIPGRALARNNRGHALLQLGRWAEAEVALEEAVELAPHLSEARVNLSLAVLCQDQLDHAVRLFRAGRWRTLGPPVPTIPIPLQPPPSGDGTIVTIEATRPTALERPPSPGLVTVRRTGDAAADLTVTYEVTGTATPGIDYVALPGSVTIPAGVLSVDVPVDPHEDDLDDPDETVVVTLRPGAGYQVDAAASATVTIGDLLLPAGQVRRAVLSGPPGTSLEIPQVFDLSLGEEGHLPPLPYPESLDQVLSLKPVYQALANQLSPRQLDRNARSGAVRSQLLSRPPLPLLTLFRITDTLIAMAGYRAEPTLHGLVAEAEGAQAAVHGITSDLSGFLISHEGLWGQATSPAACPFGSGHDACVQAATDQYVCDPIRAAHPHWRTAAARMDAAVRALFGPASRYQAAVAANIADPLYHELGMIESAETDADLTFYVRLVGEVNFYINTVYGHLNTPGPYGCGEAAPPPVNTPTDTPQVTDAGACPPALTAAKFQVKLLDVLGVSFNCESVELEVSEPGLGLFGQIGFKQRPGQNPEATLFVGAKASLPGLPFGAKEGFFLRADSQQFRDAGFKVSASTLVGLPAGGLKVDSPFNVEFGVAAASQYLAGD